MDNYNINPPLIEEPDFKIPPRLNEYPRVPLRDDVVLIALSPHSETPTVTTMGEIFSAIYSALANRTTAFKDEEGKVIDFILEHDLLPPSDAAVFSSARTMSEIVAAIGNLNLMSTEVYSPIEYPEI